MFDVVLTPAAQADFEALPLVIQARVLSIFVRLARWPAVSGVKALRHDLQGLLRIRTGSYRVVFGVASAAKLITIRTINDRKDVYR